MFGPRLYHADDYAIGQLYLDLYERDRDPAKIEPLRNLFSIIKHNPPQDSLTFEFVRGKGDVTGKEYTYIPCQSRWCWADALFMGPPVWIQLAEVTGDRTYLDYADKEFWATVDKLWDKDDHLFFRDSTFFDKREPNGQKVIWARGVGWVSAGMARILEHLPKDHPRRAEYETIFRTMMTRLAAQQTWQSNGVRATSCSFTPTGSTSGSTIARTPTRSTSCRVVPRSRAGLVR